MSSPPPTTELTAQQINVQMQLCDVDFKKGQAAIPPQRSYVYYCFKEEGSTECHQVCYGLESVDYSTPNKQNGTATRLHVRDENRNHFTIPHEHDDDVGEARIVYTRIDPMNAETRAFYLSAFGAQDTIRKQQEEMQRMLSTIHQQQQANATLQNNQQQGAQPFNMTTHQGAPGQPTTTTTTTASTCLDVNSASDPKLWEQHIKTMSDANEASRLQAMRYKPVEHKHEVVRALRVQQHLLRVHVALQNLDGDAAQAELQQASICLTAGPEMHLMLANGMHHVFAIATAEEIGNTNAPAHVTAARTTAAAQVKAMMVQPRILQRGGRGGGGPRGGGGRGGGGRGGGGRGGWNWNNNNNNNSNNSNNNNNNNHPPRGGG